MTTNLPTKLEDLLRQRSVGADRITMNIGLDMRDFCGILWT